MGSIETELNARQSENQRMKNLPSMNFGKYSFLMKYSKSIMWKSTHIMIYENSQWVNSSFLINRCKIFHFQNEKMFGKVDKITAQKLTTQQEWGRTVDQLQNCGKEKGAILFSRLPHFAFSSTSSASQNAQSLSHSMVQIEERNERKHHNAKGSKPEK